MARALMVLATLLLLVNSSSAFAADAGETPEQRFYRAWFLEIGERQIEEPLRVYRELLGAFPERAEMRARVRVRIAACELKLGRREEALKFINLAAQVKGLPEPIRNDIDRVRRLIFSEGKGDGKRAGDQKEKKPPAPTPVDRGKDPVQGAIDRGLLWLRRHQQPDGSWSSRDFTLQCAGGGCRNLNPYLSGDGRGFDGYDVGVTALALYAFVSAGVTHKEGGQEQHRRAVRQAMEWLVKQQCLDDDPRRNGRIGPEEPAESVYNHAIATLALGELLLLSRDRDHLAEPVARAVNRILAHLISREGEVVPRDELLREIWGVRAQPRDRTVDNYVVKLRRKIEKEPRRPRHLLTVHGVGYRFVR